MDNFYFDFLQGYALPPNVQVQKGTNSIRYIVTSDTGYTDTIMYDTIPYTKLIFFNIHEPSLPNDMGEMSEIIPPIQFNYCIDGRIELLLDDNTYIYMTQNDFSLSKQSAQNESNFPSGFYQGITIYFEPDFFSEENKAVKELFQMDFSFLPKIYFSKKDTFIKDAGKNLKAIAEKMWQLKDNNISTSFDMKICTLELLHCLLENSQNTPEKPLTYYTGSQVEIAKKAEHILTTDLKEHIPIREVAAKLGISETSLKNYFRGVYGKNVSDYLRDLRMTTAEKLLTETTLPISEISSKVGYAKQGKFADVFRKYYSMNPLEYRRFKKIENI